MRISPRKIKNSVLIAITLAVLTDLPAAESFDIGGRKISIPAPDGYVRVTPSMHTLMRAIEQLDDPYTDTLAWFIHESAVPAALSGEIPDLERYFVAKIDSKSRAIEVDQDNFSEFKATLLAQNRKVFEDLNRKSPGLTERLSQNLSREFDSSIAFQIPHILPLDAHYSTRDSVSYSSFMTVSTQHESESSQAIVTATTTVVNASGRILLLYTYGGKDHLDWTRSASQSWQTEILATNPSPPKKYIFMNIDWGKVVSHAILWGVICGVLAWGSAVAAKKRKRF